MLGVHGYLYKLYGLRVVFDRFEYFAALDSLSLTKQALLTAPGRPQLFLAALEPDLDER
jgi:hypothetical protein